MAARPFAWERSYPPGLRWDAPLDITTIPSLLDTAAARFGDRTAIEFCDHTLSYAQLRQEADRAGSGLLRAGLQPGDRLALYLPNTPYHPLAFFGAAKAGIRLVHLSPLEAERELQHKLADSGARTLVTTDAAPLFAMAQKLRAHGLLDSIIVGEERRFGTPSSPARTGAREQAIRFTELMNRADARSTWPDVRPEDIALLQYTGGTTGIPKGAILTHANITAAVGSYELWSRAQGLSLATEKVICVLPLFHIYALVTVLLRHLKLGNEILLRPRFDVESVLHDIEVKRATVFPGVPTMWTALANHPGIEKHDLSSLRQCSSGGAPLPVEVGQRFEKLTGISLRGGWGMTETAPAGTNLPRSGPTKPGSVGVPLPGVELGVVALDDPRRELAPGELGELRVRGPNVTQGYWNRPEETAAAFADGYLLTGDIGSMDKDGYFFLVDRKKDMIICGGFNVYPQMVEQAIYEHPWVAEVLVVGVPDEYRGESAKAFVRLRPGTPTLSLEELQSFLSDKIGRHAIPRALEIRDALPRTPAGKLSKLELRAEERQKQATRMRRTA